jgi:hypothetical protein
LTLSCDDLRRLLAESNVPEGVRRAGWRSGGDIAESVRSSKRQRRLSTIIDAAAVAGRTGRVRGALVDLNAVVGRVVDSMQATAAGATRW